MKSWRAVLARNEPPFRAESLALGAAALIAGLVVAGACLVSIELRRPHIQDRDSADTSVAPVSDRRRVQADSIVVAAVTEAQRRWTDAFPAHVRTNERHTANVGSPVRGQVARVFVQPGQKVRAGEKLFSVTGPRAASMLEEADRSEQILTGARIAEQRIAALTRSGALKEEDVASARRNATEFRQARLSASSRIKAWSRGKGRDELIVNTPASGTVVERKVEVGQTVDAGEPGLVVIADTSNVWVTAEVRETGALNIFSGTEARVFVTSASDTPFQARVQSVSPVIDRSHSIWVRMELENPRGRLQPNAPAKVQFFTDAPQSSVDVPASAVRGHGSGQYIYVKEQSGAFSVRSITTEDTRDGFTVVTHGLTIGEIVVVRGAALLDDIG